jgi:hypothetical protein
VEKVRRRRRGRRKKDQEEREVGYPSTSILSTLLSPLLAFTTVAFRLFTVSFVCLLVFSEKMKKNEKEKEGG